MIKRVTYHDKVEFIPEIKMIVQHPQINQYDTPHYKMSDKNNINSEYKLETNKQKQQQEKHTKCDVLCNHHSINIYETQNLDN